MNDSGQRVNGRHKGDQYKPVHTQWTIPPHQMKDNHTIRLMAVMAEHDSAIQERNIALSEKKAALAERDMALLQRDAAMAERDMAIIERDNAISALRKSGCPSHGPPKPQVTKKPCNNSLDEHTNKRPRKETEQQQKRLQPSKRRSLNKQAVFVKPLNDWGGNMEGTKHHNEWKAEDLGLNQVTFDESTMPAPVCSCTGKYQQCYKWGDGGWQSACCTKTLSMYPLPLMPNKRHGRIGGRKMSGSAFTKLLSRKAASGHDLSVALDLREHWARHGTNRYITIK